MKRVFASRISWILSISFFHLSTLGASYFPLEKIRPGLTGFALSCFNGTEPERFEVVITSVIRDSNPGSYQILGKVSGEPVENGGIMAGMSGSPVYIDNQLMGAIAYAFPFSKESVCGITPIQYMDPYWQISPPEKAARFNLLTENPNHILSTISSSIESIPQIIQSPMMFSHAAPGFSDFLKKIPLPDFLPVQGGAAGSSPTSEINIVPGGVIGAGLIDGDIKIAAMGTITAVDENKVLAFGHSLFQEGECRVPLVSGEGAGYLANLVSSYKIFNIGKVIGTLFRDYQHGVAGIIGSETGMVPVTVTISDFAGQSHTHHLRVIDDEERLIPFTVFGLAGALSFYQQVSGDRSYRIETICNIDRHDSVKIRRISGKSDSIYDELYAALSPIGYLMTNPIEKLSVTSLFVYIEMSDRHHLMSCEDMRILKRRNFPGDKIPIELTVRAEREKPIVRVIDLAIPENVLPGDYVVRFMDSNEYQNFRSSFEIPAERQSDIGAYITQITQTPVADELHIILLKKTQDTMAGNSVLPNVPPSFLAALKASKTDLDIHDSGVILAETTVRFDSQIIGRKDLPVTISSRH